MPPAQHAVPGDQKLRPKSARKPLQPKNSFSIETPDANTNVKSKQEWAEISLGTESNKENHPIYVTPAKIQPFDASLAEELSAIRKKLERLRLDREKTEKMLNERTTVLDMQMEELLHRGEIQKMLEIEVDRLYRLRELKLYCMKISPIRSLRDKQREKRNFIDETRLQESRAEDLEESVGENILQSSGSSSPEVSSKEDLV
ncbi:uncharacterized protein LOC110811634 [Carica papaya]|uniref:uncharacterized protein LOC110811634 n=1 Tax=Carica papaya TaxID=3649 RepID=UPI000B8CD67B|nr:uncharacterized protein LOC110811634 [Carica papaya]